MSINFRTILLTGALLIFMVIIHELTIKDSTSTAPPLSNFNSASYSLNNDELPCVLPDLAEVALASPPDTKDWLFGESKSLGITFKYPSEWKIRNEGNSGLTVMPPQSGSRYLPFKGDGDEVYGIHITTSVDYNSLGSITTKSVTDRLNYLRFPIKTRLINTNNTTVLLAYCIYNYSEGVTALIPSDTNVIQIAISRFANGLTSKEDWVTFSGILNSLQIVSKY